MMPAEGKDLNIDSCELYGDSERMRRKSWELWGILEEWEMLRQGDRWISGISIFIFRLATKSMGKNHRKKAQFHADDRADSIG